MDFQGIPVDDSQIRFMINSMVSGQPKELTDSSPETYYLRDLLEREGIWEDYDFSGAVWWNKDRTAALLRF